MTEYYNMKIVTMYVYVHVETEGFISSEKLCFD